MTTLKAKVGGVWTAVGTPVNSWNGAWGVVAMGQFKVGLANPIPVTTSIQRITEPIVLTMISGRRYRLVLQLRAVTATTAGSVIIDPYDNGVNQNTIWGDWYVGALPSGYDALTTGFIVEGDGAAHSIEMWATTQAGTASAHWNQNCRFYVEDIGPVSGYVAAPNPTPAWIVVTTFTNGWSAYDTIPTGYQQPRYRKVGDMVQIEGAVKGGTIATTAWTLPAGYYPQRALQFPSASWAAVSAIVVVGNNGAVIPNNGDNRFMGHQFQFSVTP